MAIERVVVTQTGNDTFTTGSIDTGLSADGKAAWKINSIKAFASNLYTAAAADQTLSAILSSQATVTVPFDPEELGRVNWAVANTAGVAVAYPVEQEKMVLVPEDRLTVQPTLYAQVSSVGTGIANVVYFEISYDVVKLSDIEVLRLLIGGA